MTRRIHHVAVAVRDLDAALGFYRDALGLPELRRTVMPDRGVEAALLGLANSHLEIVQSLDDKGTVARFIERRGEALHHVCFTSDDIAADMLDMRQRDIDLLDDEPHAGLAGLVCFLHPRAHAGVLVELVQPLIASPHPVTRALREVWALNFDHGAAIAAWRTGLQLEPTENSPTSADIMVDDVVIRVTESPTLPTTRPALEGLLGIDLAIDDLPAFRDHLQAHGFTLYPGAQGGLFVTQAPGLGFSLSLSAATGK